jgi:hypothetical protein
MQFTNMYIMLKWCQNVFVEKIDNFLKIYLTACKFVLACYDKNVICDSTIWKKKMRKIKNDDVVHYSTSY